MRSARPQSRLTRLDRSTLRITRHCSLGALCAAEDNAPWGVPVRQAAKLTVLFDHARSQERTDQAEDFVVAHPFGHQAHEDPMVDVVERLQYLLPTSRTQRADWENMTSCWSARGYRNASSSIIQPRFHQGPGSASSNSATVTAASHSGHSPPGPRLPHKSEVFLAVLRADGPFTATFALINGVGPAWPGGRQFCDSLPGVPAPTVSGSPARPRAELLAAGGDERALADGAGHRDAIVTQRGILVDFCGGATR